MTNRGIFKGRFTPSSMADQISAGTWGASRQAAGTPSVLQQWGGTGTVAAAPCVISIDMSGQAPGVRVESAWVTIAEELPCDMEGIQFTAWGFASTASYFTYYFEFAIGKPGKEKVIIPGILVSMRETVVNTIEYIGPVPVKFPAGSRVSVRIFSERSSTVATTVRMTSIFHRRWPGAGTKCVRFPDYVTPDLGHISGGSVHTKTGWFYLDHTPIDARWILHSAGFQTQINSATILVDYSYLDSSGNNVVFLENVPVHTNSSENITVGSQIPIPCNIPAGSNIQVRMQAGSVTVSVQQVAQLLLIGD